MVRFRCKHPFGVFLSPNGNRGLKTSVCMFAVVFVCIQSWHENTKLMFVNISQHLHSTYTSDSNEVLLKNVEKSTPILTKTQMLSTVLILLLSLLYVYCLSFLTFSCGMINKNGVITKKPQYI